MTLIGDECDADSDADDEELGKCVKVDVLRCKVWYNCIRSIVSTSDYIAVGREVGVALLTAVCPQTQPQVFARLPILKFSSITCSVHFL